MDELKVLMDEKAYEAYLKEDSHDTSSHST